MSEGSILIVSNELSVSRALRIALTAKGYKVTNARTVTEAVELGESGRHDLVLLDNDSSSATACREIRACSDAPIIVIGSDNSEEKRTHAILAGADDYVPKPFGVAEIFAGVRANMRTHKMKVNRQVLVS